MNSVLMLSALIFATGSFFGCSVGMALSGKKEPNLTVVQPGVDRSVVETQLGTPMNVVSLEAGKCFCEYEYEIGNEPSAGRAIAHGVLDVVTIGLWEIVGTPIEGFQGDKRRLLITYDANNKVEVIGGANPKNSDKPTEPK